MDTQSSVLDVSIQSTPDATADSLSLDLSTTSTTRSTQLLKLPCPPGCPSMDLLDPSSTDGHYLEQDEVDAMLQLAYGSSLVLPEHQEDESDWISRWITVTRFTGSHYNLPRGSCGRRFITMLIEEIQLLVNGSFPSKRLIIFSSVILQRERSVSKTRDIIRSLNRRLDMWRDEKFDLLVQEASRCDRAYNIKRRRPNHPDHVERVFTRLMLHGKVRAAMRWLT